MMIVVPVLLCLRDRVKEAGTNSFVLNPRIHLKISLVLSCFRTGLDVARRPQPSPRSAKVVRQETTAWVSWVGGMVSISPTTCCLWLWVRKKNTR